jgi:hypothetical protein
MELIVKKRAKRKYATQTIILYKSGMLSNEVLDTIPKSTRQYWDKFKLEEQFGYGTWWTTVEEFNNFVLLFQLQYL